MKTLPGINYFTFADYLLLALLVICIITDLKNRRVYNIVLLPFLCVALGVSFITGGWPLLLDSLEGFLIGLALLFIPFSKGGIGAGDVKLLAVIGAIKGPAFVISTFLAGALAGGVLSLIFLAANRRLLATLSGYLHSLAGLLIRYGVAIRAGGSITEEKQVYFPYTLAIGTGVAAVYMTGLQALMRW
ncbi:MAG: A24 family peptidase [Desulfocucumaceae bacterium]